MKMRQYVRLFHDEVKLPNSTLGLNGVYHRSQRWAFGTDVLHMLLPALTDLTALIPWCLSALLPDYEISTRDLGASSDGRRVKARVGQFSR